MTRHCATGRCRRLAAYVVTAHGEDEFMQVQCCQVCLPRITKTARRIGNERIDIIPPTPSNSLFPEGA